MTDATRITIIDPFPVSELGQLYQTKDSTPLKKSALNDRLNALGIKSFSQIGQGAKRFVHASDVLRLNTLDLHIRETGMMTGFPDLIAASGGSIDLPGGDGESSTGITAGTSARAVKSQTSAPTIWQALSQMSAQDAIAYLAKPLQNVFYPSHRKTEDAIRTLSLAMREDALLSTSRLADLLDVSPASFSGKKSVARMGFKFIRVGKEGRETAWRVVKVQLPPLDG